MQAITDNVITQKIHGNFNAVDYSARPDPIAYAPERVTFVSFIPNNGDCGNSLKVSGASGVHGFCHLEGSPFIKAGQTFERGQPMFKMGFTGKTIPVGEAGRHVHWILSRNGQWVYPPAFINESFIKLGDNMATDRLTKEEVAAIFQLAFDNNEYPEDLIRAYTGKPLQGLVQQLQADPTYLAYKKRVNSPAANPVADNLLKAVQEAAKG